MKSIIYLAFVAMTVLFCSNIYAQVATTDSIYQQLYQNDSLIFERGFNKCEFVYFEKLISEDFDFYHDQWGITPTKEAFINSIKNNICGLPYRPRRALEKGSLEVFILENNGVIYGAIQYGKHRFYANEAGREEYFTSRARFTHIWLLEEGIWRLQKSYSYDHQTDEEGN